MNNKAFKLMLGRMSPKVHCQ